MTDLMFNKQTYVQKYRVSKKVKRNSKAEKNNDSVHAVAKHKDLVLKHAWRWMANPSVIEATLMEYADQNHTVCMYKCIS